MQTKRLEKFETPDAAPLEIKRGAMRGLLVDAAGVFEGYASLFNIADLGRDVILPGAFSECLRRKSTASIKMLWQHEAKQPVGVWLSIEEDQRGLKVRGRLNLEVARAREIHSLMGEGAVDGLSIGFRTVDARRDRKSGLRHLARIDLWEISIVTFPMLPQARVGAVKRVAPHPGGFSPDLVVAGRAVSRALQHAVQILR